MSRRAGRIAAFVALIACVACADPAAPEAQVIVACRPLLWHTFVLDDGSRHPTPIGIDPIACEDSVGFRAWVFMIMPVKPERPDSVTFRWLTADSLRRGA